MKPNFALSLSFEGIRLLHREPHDWGLVGEVGLDSPDLSADLAVLRGKAEALRDGPINTKIIVPNDQIKYLDVDAGDMDKSTLQAAVLQALDGATPYSVDELAFDFANNGAKIHIAAVARETLAEAEAFAVEHAFNPLGFVAIPDPAIFPGEPNFGPSLAANGASFESDTAAIVVTGPAAPVPVAAPALEAPVVAAPESPATAPAPQPSPEPAPVGFASVRKADPVGSAPTPKLSGADRTAAAAPLATPALGGASHAEVPSAAPAVTGKSTAALDEAAVQIEAHGLRPGAADAPAGFATAPIVPPASEIAAPITSEAAPKKTADITAKLSGFAGLAAAAAGTGAAKLKALKPAKTAATPVADPIPAPKDSVDPVDEETQRMTVFGARKPAKRKAKGKPAIKIGVKPRFLGLILTSLLLLFLVTVAAWASVYLDTGLARFFGGNRSEAVLATLPEPVEDDRAQDAPQAIEMAALDIDDMAADTLTDADSVLPQPQLAPVLSPEEVEARYAATGIWQASPEQPLPPANIGVDDVYEASIDAEVSTHDAIALPGRAIAAGDATPRTPGVPPPPGTTFDVGADGLIVAVPNGALTPEGVLVFSGKPVVVPPAIPERLAALRQQQAVSVETTVETVSTLRPRLRPSDLIETNERANLGGISISELAQKRPRVRPATEKPPEVIDAPATALAIASSPKPANRPGNFARIVKRAERVAPEEQEATRVASVAPRVIKPRNPTTTSVAKAATVRNAINLRRVNLIGVYGKPSSRRALVRLSSGRYKKVKVGDRIDGGRVAAIGETQLRYTKGGRNVVLNMPKS